MEDSTSSLANKRASSPTFTHTYSMSLLAAMALLAGMVQGVVVQISAYVWPLSNPCGAWLPKSSALKRTKIELDLISLYSISASAKAVSQ